MATREQLHAVLQEVEARVGPLLDQAARVRMV